MNEFVNKYLAFLRANGVEQKPTIEVSDGDRIPGYEPPIIIVWRNGSGQLRQGVSLIELDAASGDGPADAARHAMFFTTGQHEFKVTWQQFTAPPPPNMVLPDPMVGNHFRDDLYYVVGSGVQEGSTYTQPSSGRRFVCVANGMFDRKWKLVSE